MWSPGFYLGEKPTDGDGLMHPDILGRMHQVVWSESKPRRMAHTSAYDLT